MKIPYNIPLYLMLIATAFFGFMLSMYLGQNISSSVFNIFLGISGLLLSLYLVHIKTSGKRMVCPTGSDCNKVIFSQYSKFFGIPLEYIGVLYYLLIIALYSALIFVPGLIPNFVIFGVFVVTAGAFLFSLYLTSIQAFALKEWCMWCLLSAVLSTTIFMVALSSLSFGLSALTSAIPWLVTSHLLSLALGIGTITLTAILFFKFLKDMRISSEELGVLRTMFEVVWFSLAIFTLTEFAIYLTNPEIFISSPQFVAKILILALIVLLSVIINLIIMPMLTAIDFGKRAKKGMEEFTKMREIAFWMGGFYVTSWFFLFVLDVLPQTGTGFPALMGYYAAALIASLAASHITNHSLLEKAEK